MTAVAVNYNGVNNSDLRDAFAGYAKLEVEGNQTVSVTLKRPFAQINLATTFADWTAAVNAGVEIKTSKVTLEGVADRINLLTGVVSTVGETPVTMTAAALPAENLTVDETAYKYMSMSYVLAGNVLPAAETSAMVSSVKYSFYEETEEELTETSVPAFEILEGLSNIPVQANWRTNIVGGLFTGNVSFDIKLTPAWDGTKTISVWDGSSATEFTEEQLAAEVIEIASAADLAGIRNAINENTSSFNGKTITLTADVDLNNMAWKPIAYGSPFAGTFDGNGHTISNLNAADLDRTEGQNATAGLFGTINGEVAVIKNINISGAVITSNKYAGVICGYASGNKGPAAIINCHVSDATVHGTNSVGGIIGLFGAIKVGAATIEDYGRLEGCTVTNTTVIGDKRVGGLAGRVYGNGQIIKDCAVENITIKPHTEGVAIDESSDDFIGVIDSKNKLLLEGTNTVDGVEVTF